MKKRRLLVIGTSFLMVLLVITAAGPWAGSQRVGSLFFSPPPPLPSESNPSKEYIYGGGRLIATEEPFPLAAPANLVAGTVSSVQVSITWSASPNAHHYQVERASNFGGTFTVLNPNVAGTSFTDNSVSAVNAYLYRVKAADAGGTLSAPSNIDLATAITFEDDPFPQSPTLTLVKAQHVLQLRQAVNAARATANLSAATWEQTQLLPSATTIMANDIQELRNKLDEALSVLGLPTGGYTDSSLSGEVIKKDHIKDLRDRLK
jgi:hypothetical protein